MKITIKTDDTLTTIAVEGRVDTFTAPEFDSQTAGVPAPGFSGDIVIDCAGMEYISSAGLRSFITLLKRATAEGCGLTVTNLNDAIRTVFDMTGFTQIFKIE